MFSRPPGHRSGEIQGAMGCTLEEVSVTCFNGSLWFLLSQHRYIIMPVLHGIWSVVVRQPLCKELNTADNPVSLEGDPSPVQPQMRPQS